MTADNRLSLQQPGGRLEIAPLRKSMVRAMHPEICSMRVAEAAKRQRCIDTEGLARSLTEVRTGKHGPIIGEASAARWLRQS
jgi:hypothetical protein